MTTPASPKGDHHREGRPSRRDGDWAAAQPLEPIRDRVHKAVNARPIQPAFTTTSRTCGKARVRCSPVHRVMTARVPFWTLVHERTEKTGDRHPTGRHNRLNLKSHVLQFSYH